MQKSYKIQYYDTISLSWKDIQKNYQSVTEAQNKYPSGKKCRIMVIEGRKRYPLAR